MQSGLSGLGVAQPQAASFTGAPGALVENGSVITLVPE
jgi:hypothetical protein